MKILNFGSLNLDHVFNVEQIVQPGQTIDSYAVNCYPGGKGLNQSLAIARAGADVFHAGMIGEDGLSLKHLLERDGVDCRFIRIIPGNTGSAFIQVDKKGQNCIVLNGGANRTNTKEFCDEVLNNFCEGDLLLLQNEINCTDYLIEKAHEKGMYIVLNPSPMNEAVLKYRLDKVSLFIMNEDEGQQITGKEVPGEILDRMQVLYSQAEVVLTLGSEGAVYRKGNQSIAQDAFQVKAVDTTAAGDTFTGYLLAAIAQHKEMKECLKLASKAAALGVMQKGAAGSIPYMQDVMRIEL